MAVVDGRGRQIALQCLAMRASLLQHRPLVQLFLPGLELVGREIGTMREANGALSFTFTATVLIRTRAPEPCATRSAPFYVAAYFVAQTGGASSKTAPCSR